MSVSVQDYACIKGKKVEMERKRFDVKIKKVENKEERLSSMILNPHKGYIKYGSKITTSS